MLLPICGRICLAVACWRTVSGGRELTADFWLPNQAAGVARCGCKRPTDVCVTINRTDLCVRPSITFPVMHSIAQMLEEPGAALERRRELRHILNRSSEVEAMALYQHRKNMVLDVPPPFKKMQAVQHSYCPAYGTENTAHVLHAIVGSLCATGGDVLEIGGGYTTAFLADAVARCKSTGTLFEFNDEEQSFLQQDNIQKGAGAAGRNSLKVFAEKWKLETGFQRSKELANVRFMWDDTGLNPLDDLNILTYLRRQQRHDPRKSVSTLVGFHWNQIWSLRTSSDLRGEKPLSEFLILYEPHKCIQRSIYFVRLWDHPELESPQEDSMSDLPEGQPDMDAELLHQLLRSLIRFLRPERLVLELRSETLLDGLLEVFRLALEQNNMDTKWEGKLVRTYDRELNELEEELLELGITEPHPFREIAETHIPWRFEHRGGYIPEYYDTDKHHHGEVRALNGTRLWPLKRMKSCSKDNDACKRHLTPGNLGLWLARGVDLALLEISKLDEEEVSQVLTLWESLSSNSGILGILCTAGRCGLDVDAHHLEDLIEGLRDTRVRLTDSLRSEYQTPQASVAVDYITVLHPSLGHGMTLILAGKRVMVPSETPPHYTHCRTLPFVPLPPETELKLVKRKHEKRSCRLCFQPVLQYSEMPQVFCPSHCNKTGPPVQTLFHNIVGQPYTLGKIDALTGATLSIDSPTADAKLRKSRKKSRTRRKEKRSQTKP